MGFNVILTPDDLKKGDLVNPGWYRLIISKYEEEIVKGSTAKPSDGSTNAYLFFKIMESKKLNTKAEAVGVEIRKMYNEKALGYGKTLWAALEFPFEEGVGYRISDTLLRQAEGSIVEGYVQRGKSDKGTEFNDLKEFRTAQAE